ncbi:androgen-dependent TFPI-regulating protein-like [Maniola hyperantus]|uniref:androgen-dependent TFPI-regulating protein-like n=1 Tax=Aphantopus hyperantus TaxID=2795564 RepID=UPI00156A484D|nr:androgen-dependent TFPI-regulating protein-like [Maniola hyperantus]
MIKSSNFLLNLRLCFYGVALLHLVFAAFTILPIDMSNDEDPRVSVYIRVRWKLLTCWFNLLSIAYLPIALYCDWKEKKGEWDKENVRTLRKIRDFMMTSILFPTTMYSDYFFWRMWTKDPALIAPVAIFKYLPPWAHHSLHTVSGVMVLLDILFLPRKRPKSILPGLMGLFAFCSIYSAVLVMSYYSGEVVYSFLDIFSRSQLCLLGLLAFTEHVFFYTLQWCIIGLVWGKPTDTIAKKID